MILSLEALAEDPEAHLPPPEGARRIANERYCVVIGSELRWAGVSRLRLPDEPAALVLTLGEIHDLVVGAMPVTWSVGSSSLPPSLPERLRVLGLRDPDPPLEPLVAAMVLTGEPSAAPAVEVSRIETFEDHLAGLEIMLAADTWSPEAAAAQRAEAPTTFERRMRRGAMQWLARIDGEPSAFACADQCDAGLFLSGGATLPAARGRGCYRALVHARWAEASRLRLPGLAVQAQLGSSAPILERLGFVHSAIVHTLQSPSAGVNG